MTSADSVSAFHSKLDVIRFHICSAIQMMAIECHPFSVHTVVMACERLILDLADSKNLLIEWHHKFWIKNEHHSAFCKIKNKAYNYFRHANEDSGDKYEGPDVNSLRDINEVQTFLNIHGYIRLTGSNEPVFNLFSLLVIARHPQLIRPDFLEDHPELQKQLSSLDRSRSSMLQVLRWMLLSADLLPNALLL